MQPNRTPNTATRARSIDAGLREHFQRVYNMMSLGLVLTGVLAYAVAHTSGLREVYQSNGILQMIVIFSPLVIIFFGLSPRRVATMSVGAVTGLYLLLTALFGISMSSIFMMYSADSLARVFFITAGMFAATSIYGYTTKKDLSGMGSLMIMGLIGILIAGIVNIFMQSTMLMFVTSAIGVVVFTGLIAWDTQNIKETYNASYDQDSKMKMAIMGALSLYLNFINLFMMLLRLFGNRN